MTIKYAIDLSIDDKIIDRHTGRVIVLDGLDGDHDIVHVSGYFEDNGEDWTRTLDCDSQIKVLS